MTVRGGSAGPEVQWRLAEVQLANWGTFDGVIYRMPIARRGHLVTGPSGSGKSSLLDAIAAVLTPDKWLRFNQAAQGSVRRTDQRTMLTYVRGAWSRTADETEDRVVSSYLRPRATWSGIVLRFEDGAGHTLTLARLFFLRATGTVAGDINDLCLLERSAVDLRDLQGYASSGLETRKVQQRWPDALVTSNHSHGRFYARLRSTFGMADETALQLLHKTQSAKNLDSLDQLFRDYMLERPVTFDVAATAVTQFGELRAAHERVVQLREQRDHLLGLQEHAARYDAASETADQARELIDAVEPYQRRRGLALAEDELADLRTEVLRLEAELERARLHREAAETALSDAEKRALQLGGGQADHLQERLRAAQEHARAVGDRWGRLDADLGRAGVQGAPRGAREYAELMATIDGLLSADHQEGPTHAQQEELATWRRQVRRIDDEITSVRRTGSTVPGNLLAVRAELAAALGIPESAVPFAAELMEVPPEHARWRGAIERVLRPFALTLLVRTSHLAEARRWIDGRSLSLRLVYEEVASLEDSPRPTRSARSLVHKVEVRDTPFQSWVRTRLAERYDYACVASPDELGDHERAVTAQGQVRSSRTRYEKDDRRPIDDRRRWILGDPAGRLDALVDERADAQRKLEEIEEVVDRLGRSRDKALRRRGILETIRHQAWTEVDRDSAESAVAEVRTQLALLTDADSDLATALRASDEARRQRDAAVALQDTARLDLAKAQGTRDELDTLVAETHADIAAGRLPEVDATAGSLLEERFRVRRHLARHNLAEVGIQVLRALQQERDQALDEARRAAEALVGAATRFTARWPESAADLTPAVADRRGYLALLDSIIAHGLPEHEANFLRLLRERSRDLIGELVSDILSAPREIDERVAPVNASLRRAPFDSGTYLRLRVKTRRTDTVNRFLTDLRSISEGSWSDDQLEAAEERFATLAEIMRRLESSDQVDRVWRQQCLDTRQHVTFLAEEIDETGRVLATYDSGAAMSGGQQQKLVIFCLAAALRYQLASPDDAYPRYGTIVLDEAFDKADTRYTRMAMDIFVEFGFQMVLATPQKLLQTVEPYVGGATSIENPTRQRCEVSQVLWEVGAS